VKSILPLEVSELTYAVRDRVLLDKVSARFDAEVRSLILGPNGAGKTLLLRVCHGLLEPSSGTVRWSGDPDGDPRRRQAMLLQRPVLLRRSARANIEYALALHGVPRAARRERAEWALQATGLLRFSDSSARVLSGGEQQRLALARIWALEPQVIFLDEPTSSLDPTAKHAIEETIEAIHASGTKIIMTSQDLGQAKRLADEILFLHHGRLLERRPAEGFFAEPENEAASAFLRGELTW
jgi:tungstate transport system ATP-binding protein